MNQHLINELEPKDFKNQIRYLKTLWDSNSKKYSSTPLGVYNTNMAPKEFFTYVRSEAELEKKNMVR